MSPFAMTRTLAIGPDGGMTKTEAAVPFEALAEAQLP